MSQKQARAFRRLAPDTHREQQTVDNQVRDKRAADTQERRQALELERADAKASGKLSPARHLLSRLNYKQVAK